MVTATLKTFVGHVLQTPPKYSALKRNGIRLADLTRQGVDIIVRPRYVDCYSISCLQFSPPDFSLEVSCGGGYYIRSLVHDLGERKYSLVCSCSLEVSCGGGYYIRSLVHDLGERKYSLVGSCSLEVSCGGGYYIRSLVHDLGERLGSCAHVTQLHRLQHGPFTEIEMLEKEDWTAPSILDAIDRARNRHGHLFKKMQRTLIKETWVER
uniref:tRNA pseudouridine(55) synthase n=1 Tax=Timema poppense TaxID=170557 RepID=A0A7R9HBS7_TIMPO|nr:unnamed protein product [Timema poppensis]